MSPAHLLGGAILAGVCIPAFLPGGPLADAPARADPGAWLRLSVALLIAGQIFWGLSALGARLSDRYGPAAPGAPALVFGGAAVRRRGRGGLARGVEDGQR